MNGAATVSPLFRPNRCKCGHDILAHNMGISPNTCPLCVFQGGNAQVHNFTPYAEPWPSTDFPAPPPSGLFCAGGFGPAGLTASTYFDATLVYNQQGATTVYFANAVQTLNTFRLLAPGMTFTTIAVNPANSHSYTILAVTTASLGPSVFAITIAPPGLVRSAATATAGVVCTFAGAMGSTMGGGLPPNGQRAG